MRLTTIGVPFFQHDGLAVGTGWHEFDYSKADKKARESFREHVGRFVKLHPDDLGELGKLGLAIKDGRIVEGKVDVRAESKADGRTDGKVDVRAEGKVDGKVDSKTDGRTEGKAR